MKLSSLPRQRMQALLKEHTAHFNQVKNWIEGRQAGGCLVIGIGMLKGGTGKTTSAIFLALYLAVVMGLKVVVVDTDDNSQSVDNWYKERERQSEEVPFDLVTFDPTDEELDLDDVIEEVGQSYDVVLVDIGGAGKEAYWEMCKIAHAVLVPLAPSGYEVSRLASTVRQAAKGGKANDKKLHVFVTLIKCDGRTSLPAEQRGAIEATLNVVKSTLSPEVLQGIEVHLTAEDFQISNSPEYPRSWDEMPRTPHLEEFGYLFRHMMKPLMAEMEAVA
jgi:hypothetical protein